MSDVVGFAGKPEHLHPSSVSNSRTDEITRLRADLADERETYTDPDGRTWHRPSARGYSQVMKVIDERDGEIEKLAAALAAVTAERDRLREAVLKADVFIRNGVELGFIRLPDTKLDPAYHTPRIVREAARAAIEGVKEPASLWQHKKTGGIYEIVGECQIESTNTSGVLYRNTSTGVTWVRPKEEFFDGRFVEWRKPEPPR